MIEVGILKNFNGGTYKAGVQLAGSLTTYFDGISVAKNIPSSAMVIGNYVIVAIPGGNPKDACVIATWPGGSAGGGAFLDLSDTPSSYSGQAGKVPKVNSEESALEFTKVTYDLLTPFTLPYQLFRNLSRFFHLQFDSYDMITEYTSGTGYTIKGFLSPQVRSGATSGGIATLYQDARWMYAFPPGSYTQIVFIGQGNVYSTTRDSTAFLGMALDDTHHITLNDTTKHCGFIFHVSGATATVYASNANGTAQTKTDLNVSPTPFVIWSIVCDKDAGTAKFYRDWQLVATHNTNIPDTSLCWKISIISAANEDQLLSTRNVIFAMY
jgi:hypothetical protein